jgi:hypothetical protein
MSANPGRRGEPYKERRGGPPWALKRMVRSESRKSKSLK